MPQRTQVALINLCMDVYPHQMTDPLVEALRERLGADVELTDSGKVFHMGQVARAVGRTKGRRPDLVVLLIGTWLDASVAITAVKELGETPWMIWTLPMLDGISTGSLVAFAVVKGTLERMGVQFEWVYGEPAEVAETIAARAKRASLISWLRGARIGLFGYAAMGMYTATFDHVAVKDRLGPEVVHFDNYVLVRQMAAVDEKRIDRTVEDRSGRWSLGDPACEAPMRRAMRMYLALKRFAADEGLDALTIKCQHEISRSWGCGCLALSLLADEGLPVTCEGDIHGTITGMMVQRLTGAHPFFADFINAADNSVWFSSCGFIPLSLTEGDVVLQQQIHEIGEEGVTCSAAPRTGPVTAARLEADAGGGYRMHIADGQAQEGYRRPYEDEHGRRELFPIMRVSLSEHSDDFLRRVCANHYLISFQPCAAELAALCRDLGISLVT
jgi:L-fucose isomerase-like protein